MPTPYVDDIAVKVGLGLSLSSNEQEDWREWFQVVSGQVAGLFQKTQSGNITEISQITNNFGKMYRGEFVAISTLSGSIDPLDVTFIGSFLSGDGHEYTTPFGTDIYNVGGVNLGELQWGGANTDGTFFAINGKFSGEITAGGATIEGPLIFPSDTYPFSAYAEWKSRDTNAVTGQLISDYAGAAVNTGLRVIGQAHDASVRGYVALWANDNAGVTKAALTVDSNGSSTFNHTATTGVASANSLSIKTKTSATAALSAMLGLYLDSSGTPASGLGPAIAFFSKNSAGAQPNIGNLSIAYNDPTSTSEDTVFGVSLMVAGALATVLSLDGVGGMTLSAPLNVSGNLAINTSKFTVAASSGNTAVAGTLGITGLATLAAGLSLTNSEARTNIQSIADDAVFSFIPNKSSGLIVIGMALANYGGLLWYNLSGTNTTIQVGGSNLASGTGALTGTTGTDVRLNVSADGTKIYIENRSGATRNVVWLLI